MKKELKKLSRLEILELLLASREENDELIKENENYKNIIESFDDEKKTLISDLEKAEKALIETRSIIKEKVRKEYEEKFNDLELMKEDIISKANKEAEEIIDKANKEKKLAAKIDDETILQIARIILENKEKYEALLKK